MKRAFIIAIFFCVQTTCVFGITGGEPAKDGEFPFMVSIRQRDNCHYCAGTIIGDRWVLTSTVCYSRAFWGEISFGSNKLANTSTPGYGNCGPYDSSTQVHIDDVLLSPTGDPYHPYAHDMTLIHLNESITFGENVQPVQLADIDEPWPDFQTGTILGWGDEEDPANPYDGLRTDLHKAQVPLFSEEYCTNSSLWEGWQLIDPSVMMCGGEVNKTYHCRYDYGGPLLVNGKQYGILSYFGADMSFSCGHFLGVYSSVSYFREWIKDTTGI